MHNHIWRQASVKLVPYAALFIVGIALSSLQGNVRHGDVERKLLAFIGVLIFVFFATLFLHALTKAVQKQIIQERLGVGRAAALQFILRTFGYLAILIATLDLLSIPVGRILLGSAVLGIILGVAAQQALANFFASIVLIISHPFAVGEEVEVMALGAKYTGKVTDIGLTHTHILESNGSLVLLPNATLLSNAAITPKSQKHLPSSETE